MGTAGFQTLAVNPLGPDQAKEEPLAVEVAVTDGVGLEQVIVALLVVTCGGVVFWVTLVSAELVQPLAGLVIVTKYVPDRLTTGLDSMDVKLPGPAQE